MVCQIFCISCLIYKTTSSSAERRQNIRNLQEGTVCVCWILNGESLTLHQSTTKKNTKNIKNTLKYINTHPREGRAETSVTQLALGGLTVRERRNEQTKTTTTRHHCVAPRDNVLRINRRGAHLGPAVIARQRVCRRGSVR